MAARKKFDPEATLDHIRDIALALPESYEELTWGEVTLRVLPEHITVPPGITVLRISPSRIRLTLAAPSSPPGEPRKGAPRS